MDYCFMLYLRKLSDKTAVLFGFDHCYLRLVLSYIQKFFNEFLIGLTVQIGH